MMNLNYTVLGQGRPIIILHGLFGSARNWQGIARTLATSYRVITPDLRNHGQSPHAEDMSYLEMADDVVAIVDQLQCNDTIIVGHSMGGKVAMTAALMNPALFSALVVVDIAPVNYNHDFKPLINAMHSLNLQSLKNRAQAASALAKVINDIGITQLLLQNLIRTGDAFQWRINLAGIMANLDLIRQFPDMIKNRTYSLPALFIGGAESDYLCKHPHAEILQYFPVAEITTIEGSGHWPHVEKPDAFLKVIKKFINSV